MLKTLTLFRDRVEDWAKYPFCIPAISSLEQLEFKSRVCFFVGENGSGKSTLLEAIAIHYGFGREGGTRSFLNDSTESNHSIDPLVRALRMSFDKRTGAGYFLRAESFFNVATTIDELGISDFYGYQSLHDKSHGESFMTLLKLKFQRNGLFLLDEPEAALSPQRQLSFLVLLHDTIRKYKDAQFIMSSHSPVLLGFPGAQVLSFDGDRIQEIGYDDIPAVHIVRHFVNDKDKFTEELFREEPTLFDE